MRIHVVGSRPKGHCDNAEFKQWTVAWTDLGAAIAARGHELSVGSITPNTIDGYVAEGFLRQNPRGSLEIYVHQASSQSILLAAALKQRFAQASIVVKLLKGGTTYSRHVHALSRASAVLVVGGNSRTMTAGHVAPAMQIPTLPLPQFGGAAKDVFDDLKIILSRSSLSDDDMKTLQEPWQLNSPTFVVQSLERIAKSNPFSRGVPSTLIYLDIACATCLCLWAAIFAALASAAPGADMGVKASAAPDFAYWSRISFFVLMFLASIIGTCLRTLLKVYFDVSESFSSRSLVSDVMIGLAVAFCFFLVYAIGGVIYKGDVQQILDAEGIVRSAAFISAVALAAALLLESSVGRMRDQIATFLAKGGK